MLSTRTRQYSGRETFGGWKLSSTQSEAGNPKSSKQGPQAGQSGKSQAARPGGGNRSGGKPASAKGRPVSPKGRQGGARPGGARNAPSKFSPAVMAYGAVGIVVLLLVVFVVVKLTGGNSSSSGSGGIAAPVLTAAPAADLSPLANVTASEQNTVGVPSSVTLPTIKKGEPALTINGKPGAVFVGGEFCPYCGAERWALIMAFDRFGTFSGLQETTSSPWDAFPSTPTFTFRTASYTSQYVDFSPVEAVGNDTTGLGTKQSLQTPTKLQQSLWVKYDNGGGSFPFVDIGNFAIMDVPSYSPGLLAGLTQSQVASQLSDPNSQVAQAIIGSANIVTAAVCAETQQQPSSVCSVQAVKKAASSMGIS